MKEQTPKSRKLSVSIGGVTYQIVSHESEDYMRTIAAQADELLTRMANIHPSLSDVQIAVLTVINLTDALNRKSDEADRLAASAGEAASRIAKAEEDLFVHRNETFELKKELLRVNELNRQLMMEITALQGTGTPDEASGAAEGDASASASGPEPDEASAPAAGPSEDEAMIESAEFVRIGMDGYDTAGLPGLEDANDGTDPEIPFPDDDDVPARSAGSGEDEGSACCGDYVQPGLDEYFSSSR